MKFVKNTLKLIQTQICSVSIFIVINSDSDSDCIITDCKEGEDCIIVTDKPLPKRYKLEPEEILHRKLIPGDGHCIANCFAVYFEETLDKVVDKLNTEFGINLQKYRNFSECSTEKITEEVYYNFKMIKQRHKRYVLICVRLTFSELSC